MDRGGRPSSLYDGDTTEESRRGTRRALYIVLVATGVVAAAVVVSVLVVSNDNTDEETVGRGSDQPTEASAASGDPQFLERVTEQGLTVRMRVADDSFNQGLQQVPAGAPAWCKEAGRLASVTIISGVAVASSQLALSQRSHPDGSGQLLLGGELEGAPMWGVVVQVPPEVVLVRATVPGAPSDEMAPVDGVAVVAMNVPAQEREGVPGWSTVPLPGPGFWPGSLDLTSAAVEFVTATGRKVRKPDGFTGPAMWNDQRCWQVQVPPPTIEPPPPPDLPPPGEQPADPDAAEAEVTRALAMLFTAPIERGREFFELIDDASGIDIGVDEQTKSRPELVDLLSTSDPDLTALVFISPIEAFFYYDLAAPYGAIVNQFGRARFVDGRWKITRGTFCQQITTYGVYCGP